VYHHPNELHVRSNHDVVVFLIRPFCSPVSSVSCVRGKYGSFRRANGMKPTAYNSGSFWVACLKIGLVLAWVCRLPMQLFGVAFVGIWIHT